MRLQTWKLAMALAASMILVLSLVHRAKAAPGDWDSGRRLEGTWIVTVTQHNCSTNAPLGPPFQSLLTFTQGGTMTETTANPAFFPAFRGPGHGIWSHAGLQSYSATSVAFLTLNGVLAKTQKISQNIEIGDDPNAFTTTAASVEFFDPAGNLLLTGCATASGKRLE